METNKNEPKPAVRRRIAKTIWSNQKSTSTFVYSVLKKISIVCVIYCVGYLNWSISWLITSIILAESRDFLMDTNVVRRKEVKALAEGGEIKILACVKDLPSWILQQMWPFVDEFFSINIIKNKLEPKIRKTLSKKKLNDFEFNSNRILLGTTPLRFGGVKVHAINTSRIILDIDNLVQ